MIRKPSPKMGAIRRSVPFSIHETATRYAVKGWAVIPIKPRSKQPRDKRWQTKRIKAHEVQDNFQPNENVGVILGEPSEWLVDIDCDWPESASLGRVLLPTTSYIFGRESRPHSHYLYRCKNAKTTKFSTGDKEDEEGAMVVELRATNLQTIFPESTHPSGELVKWHRGRLPEEGVPELTPEALQTAVGRLAAASLLRRHWLPGIRDDLALAACGVMLRGGLPTDVIDLILEAVAIDAGDEELEARLKAEYQKHRLEADEHVPGIPALKDIMGKRDLELFMRWLRIQKTDLVDRFGETHALVITGSECIVVEETHNPRGETETRFFSPAALRLFHGHENILIGKKEVNVVDVWVSAPTTRRYNWLVFNPNSGGHQLNGTNVYNLWRGYSVNPVKGDCSRYLNHIKEVICSGDEDYYEWVMAFLANIVQHPTRRPGVSLVLRGDEGIGKGKFVNWFGKLFGPHYVQVSQPSQLIGRFNNHMKDKLVVFADEAFWAGDKAGQGALNRLITEPTQVIEPKGVDPFTVDNYVHLIIASNHDWVVPANFSARRFTVLDVSDAHARDRKYFGALDREMENGGLEALLYELQHWKYDLDALARVLDTDALAEQKLASNPVLGWWEEVLDRGYQIHTLAKKHRMWQELLAKNEVYEDYSNYCKKRGFRPESKIVFWKQFRGICEFSVYRGRSNSDTQRAPRQVKFHALGYYRATFRDSLSNPD